MSYRAPRLDPRNAANVAAKLAGLLGDIDEYRGKPLPPDPLRDALVGIVARFSELVIDRLNQMPDKNFMVFLNLLGASQLPPQPARAPLVFSLAVGRTLPTLVPAGTQVAAAPGAGEKDPVVFETERELVVMPVRLSCVFGGDPDDPRHADLVALAGDAGARGQAVKGPLWLGFASTGSGAPPNQPLSLYVGTVQGSSAVRVTWDYWNGQWMPLRVDDDTQDLSRPGIVQFLVPPDMVAKNEFGVGDRYWVRAHWDAGEPWLARLAVNTTMAAHTTTVRDEVLGASDGSRSQRLATTRSPILAGPRLEVREPELPAAVERASLEAEEGAGTLRPDAAGRGYWVRWHEVPDFHASGPRARHYVVDHLAGTILFGDGRNGLVPPAGADNLRLARYQTGGGSVGNRAAGTIAQLKTTVPYVDRVTNPEPASGGSDAEPLQSVAERVPRQLRHGGRAVTVEDYEDLACEASPAVARALCVAPAEPEEGNAGLVQVIVVPHSAERQPTPGVELLRRVKDYLDARRCATAALQVVPPDYLVVTVKVRVAVNSAAASLTVVPAVRERIEAWLHPLSGGADGTGWDFGALPRDLDLYVLVAHVPGVDHVSWLEVDRARDSDLIRSGRFLVCAGPPVVTATT